ncbi:HEPN domain-containing protein [Kitasatospora sp. NPDC058406]|uniref:ApeA N-terminal domain 1-containing protein n=1 Tax=Kitasatospora sp. NPDC058406 TaxID=3346483 RepID=UPI0036504C64
MIESRSGVWWTDDDPSVRVPGTLARAGERWQLDLIGTLRVNQQWEDQLSLVPPATIYGACSGKRYTLRDSYLSHTNGPSIHIPGPRDQSDQADDQFSQTWFGFSLLDGDALSEDTIYSRASFELSGLSEWWPFSALQGSDAPTDIVGYRPPEPTVAECDNGMTVTITALGSGGHGRRSHSLTERVVVAVEREAGFTLEELLEQAVIPLQALLAIIFDRRVEYFNLRLRPHPDANSEYSSHAALLPISFDPDVIESKHEKDAIREFPFFTAKDVQASEFIAKWISTSSRSVVPVSVAAPTSQAGSFQIQVVEAVNAAESLHRELHAEPSSSGFAEKVREALKVAGGLNSEERRKVVSAVKMTEVTLEARLLQLAQELGEEFCAWFFDGQVKDWAAIAATVRNALSHGYQTKHRIEHDPGALSGVLQITLAVIRLRLLTEAGLPQDHALIELLSKDPRYRALMRQSVADWGALRATMGS